VLRAFAAPAARPGPGRPPAPGQPPDADPGRSFWKR
jgi:hypothetical protein